MLQLFCHQPTDHAIRNDYRDRTICSPRPRHFLFTIETRP